MELDGMTAHNPAMKAPEDFKPFEQVLLRDADDQPWRKDLFNKRTDAHKPYVGLVLGKGWSQCIPFAGNEKLDGVVTP